MLRLDQSMERADGKVGEEMRETLNKVKTAAHRT